MSEFVNVLEVDKLPLDAIDRFIGIDSDGELKSASVSIDKFLNGASNNAVSNSAVTNAIKGIQDTIGAIDDMLLEIIGEDD